MPSRARLSCMYCVRRSASSAASSSSLSLLMAVSRDWISQSRVLTVCSQVCTSFEYSKRWRLCLASSFSFSSSETLAPCEKCFMSVTVDRSRSSSLRIWMIKSFRPRRSWLMVSANTLLTLSASDTRSSLIARLDLSLRTWLGSGSGSGSGLGLGLTRLQLAHRCVPLAQRSPLEAQGALAARLLGAPLALHL